MSQCSDLASADYLRRPRQPHHSIARGPHRTLLSAFSDCSQCTIRATQCHRRRRRSTGPSPGRGGGTASPLKDTKRNLRGRQNTNKLNVCPMREKRTYADLRPKLLPAQPMRSEPITVDKENEMRVANIHHRTGDLTNARQHNRALHDPRNPHLAFDQVQRIARLHHVTGTQSAMSP